MPGRRGWFIETGDAPTSVPNLYTFVHAGGRADRFLEWQPDLRELVRVVAVCAPGTGHRFAEPRPDDLTALAEDAAEAIAAHATEPFFLFGHSLGALTAYETARRLPRAPAALTVSGCAGPPLLPSERVRRLAALEPAAFAEEVRFFGGIPPEIESGSAAATLLLGPLHRDFAMAAAYRYRPGPPLDVPVTAVVAADDPHVGPEGAARWQDVTAHPLEHREVRGGHFYFEDDAGAATAVLRRVVDRHRPTAETHVELI
ncbi:thioesterase II family protein [Glycomyces harbinensis]|uniref:Medium-chain acyl-[acyl-carrier-protein] hydrolase n=1 Tax=Glycomyces harbinensis TaxID=58114 RepID=A0A1G6ZIY0_9ACTN|nr:alpha/beta fold hydrolase [Glycomyces harbinensis]SDE02609.1 medium-chain acyl-[acyl-carrier-protein] hydrolase [Glycomyces harbinensis]